MVIGWSREPVPPAKIMPFISEIPSIPLELGKMSDFSGLLARPARRADAKRRRPWHCAAPRRHLDWTIVGTRIPRNEICYPLGGAYWNDRS